MYAFLHVSLLQEKAVTKPYPNQTNLVSFYSSWIALFNSARRKFIVSMVTQLRRFLIRTRINVIQLLWRELILLSLYSKKAVCYCTKNSITLIWKEWVDVPQWNSGRRKFVAFPDQKLPFKVWFIKSYFHRLLYKLFYA